MPLLAVHAFSLQCGVCRRYMALPGRRLAEDPTEARLFPLIAQAVIAAQNQDWHLEGAFTTCPDCHSPPPHDTPHPPPTSAPPHKET